MFLWLRRRKRCYFVESVHLALWAASLAAHDDNHLDQLARALDGCP